MTAMASPVPSKARLPQLSGRWLLLYQLLWIALACTAIVVMVSSIFDADTDLPVLVLRTLKGVVLITVCAILLRRRKNDPVAALLSLAFLTWTITSSFDFASADLLPMLADRLRFLLFAIALLLFPDGRWLVAWTRHVAIASAVVFMLGIVEGLAIMPTHLFLPLAIICVVAAVSALIARFRTAQSEAVRQQLKWVALGLVSGIALILSARAGAALSNGSPRLPTVPILWEGLFQLGIIVIALGFLVSLLRYRLFDAETAISRSAALAVLTLALVATFAGTEAAIEWIGQQYLGMGIGNVSAAMAAAVAAVLLNPLHDRISGWAEHHFQRDLVALRRELPELLEDLAGIASAKEIGVAALARICEAVHATRAVVVVADTAIAAHGVDDRERLREIALSSHSKDLFPLRIPMHSGGGASAGSLLLGPRPDGSLYGKDDLDALDQVLPALRRRLVVAMSNEAARAEWRRQASMLVHELKDVRRRLLALKASTA